MRKALGTLVIIALIVAGVGFYRGWFGVSTEDQPGETNVELRIDKDKIKQDAEAASEKARGLASQNDVPSDDQPEESVTDEDPSAAERE
jgi:hypothetical protein